MRRHLAYLKYVLRHKWYVFVECCKLGIPWLGIVHDWSKFRPSEWLPYSRYFYNPDGTCRQVRDEAGGFVQDAALDFAWLLHQKRNKHHWQWWILSEDEGGLKAFPLGDRYRREMLADWRGVGHAIMGQDNTRNWYELRKREIHLHSETRQWVEETLALEV